MAIDTQELRRKVNSTDIVDHIDLHANIKPFLSELLDRLEAAESDAIEQARLNGMGSEREAALMAKLEAAEKERDAARDLADRLALALNTSNHERDNLRAKIAEMGRPGAEWFDWLPQGTSHISSIRLVTIPCFGLEARFNAFKYIDGVLYTYRTDSDNEYGEWVKADSRYRNGVLPTIYPLSGAQPAPSVPELIESLRCACNYIDKLGGVSQQYRAMLAAAPEVKP